MYIFTNVFVVNANKFVKAIDAKKVKAFYLLT